MASRPGEVKGVAATLLVRLAGPLGPADATLKTPLVKLKKGQSPGLPTMLLKLLGLVTLAPLNKVEALSRSERAAGHNLQHTAVSHGSAGIDGTVNQGRSVYRKGIRGTSLQRDVAIDRQRTDPSITRRERGAVGEDALNGTVACQRASINFCRSCVSVVAVQRQRAIAILVRPPSVALSPPMLLWLSG